jgi:hypothetical protein
VLLLACPGLSGALVVKIVDSRKENIVPIVINEATGDALVIDCRVIDSTGETDRKKSCIFLPDRNAHDISVKCKGRIIIRPLI